MADASEINYNKSGIPLMEYENSSLIESIYGHYSLDGELFYGGKIADIQNDNIDFDYYLNGTYEENSSKIDILGFNNSRYTFNKSTLLFNLNYSTSANVKTIIPFNFNLHKWPEAILFVNTTYSPREPFAIIGDDKVLVFPLLSKPYFYNIQIINESVKVSVVANSSIHHDDLEMEITFLILEEVNDLFVNENIFPSQKSLRSPTEPWIFPFSNVTIGNETETITTNFHNLTPKDLLDWNFSEGSSLMVINGKLLMGYTPDKLNQFLIGENATLEPITLEDASKLNQSDWIYDGTLFYRVVKLKEEFIEDIIIELKGTLNNFQTGDFFSNVQIKIEVNESAIKQEYINDKAILSNLTLTYNEKSTIVKYDYEQNAYLFADDINLIGNYHLYPIDYYIASIEVNGGELIEKHQTFKSQDSGFSLDVNFNNNIITIKKSRHILFRFLSSIVILIIFGYLLNHYIKTLEKDKLTSNKKIELSLGALSILGVALTIGFVDFNYIYSLGVLPFLAFVLFFAFKIKPTIK
jgi:hypothetical protein